MGWQDDKAWSDRYLDEVKGILGRVLIGPAPEEDDRERNTDLIVLKMDSVRIACRIRREEYFRKFPHQFTIRTSRPNGNKTELAKIVEGWGDYFFYGFGGTDSLLWWGLGDLKAFRLRFNAYIVNNGGQMPGELLTNSDGSSEFRAIDWSDMRGFLMASSGSIDNERIARN